MIGTLISICGWLALALPPGLAWLTIMRGVERKLPGGRMPYVLHLILTGVSLILPLVLMSGLLAWLNATDCTVIPTFQGCTDTAEATGRALHLTSLRIARYGATITVVTLVLLVVSAFVARRPS